MPTSSSNITIDDLVIDNEALYESIRKSFSRDPFDHYVNGVIGLFICLIGTISNALSFSVLIRRTMRLSTYVYVAGLCLSDFTTCLFLIPGYVLDAYPVDVPDFELPRSYTYTQILITAGAISTTARALSVWLCVAFTIDRWIMICRPFIGPQYCTLRNARIVTVIIYIVGVLYAVPLMFEFEPREERSLSEILLVNHQHEIYHRALSRLGSNGVFRWTYVLINALGVYVIPLTVIAILNRQLLISIRSLERRSAEYNAPSPTKQGVTAMLLATTIMLLVLRIPSATVSIMWITSAKMFINEKHPFILRKFHLLANLCATLNAATTFIPFIIYGTKFRSEFTRIYGSFGCRLIRRKTNGEQVEDESEYRQMKLFMRNDQLYGKNSVGSEYIVLSTRRAKLPELNFEVNHDTRDDDFRRNSSATTSITSPSIQISTAMKHFDRDQHKESLLFEHANHSENPLVTNENQRNHENDDTRSNSMNKSYYGWFKRMISWH